MPADNIKRAIIRGTGELEGGQIDEILFEGTARGRGGPGFHGNRQSKSHRKRDRACVFKERQQLGEQGSVSWMFERKARSSLMPPMQMKRN